MFDFESIISLDFETHPILNRPHFPPEPVGLAIKEGFSASDYLHWGHPDQANSDPEEVKRVLTWSWKSGRPILFFNAKFDLQVAYEKFDMPELPWDRVHDSSFLAYLVDPYQRRADLKTLAEKLLDYPPEERDAVYEWIIEHKHELVQKYPHYRTINKDGNPVNNITPTKAGAWIFAAPAALVGPYAIGDTDRTFDLFVKLYPIIERHGMLPAYNREREFLRILLENERIGMRTDVDRLGEDIEYYEEVFKYVEDELRKILRAPDLNFNADQDFADALEHAGIVDPESWVRTSPSKTHPNGQRSVAKNNLTVDMFKDPNVASAIGYRNRLETCLKMFMRPWFKQATENNGYISTNWNQISGEKGGTRTGRPSTRSPNILNISKDFEGRPDGYVHPEFLNIEKLPLVRKYILPDEGDVFIHRDFDGQELRIFAHMSQGQLLQQYQKNPALDVHHFVGVKMEEVSGQDLTSKKARTKVKALNFQSLYGGGAPALSRELRISLQDARELKSFHDQALPDRKILDEEIKRIVREGAPIVTWGGRLFFLAPPKFVDGRWRNCDYVMINYDIQGSAADVTKEACNRWYRHPDRQARFMSTVYDEINGSAPHHRWRKDLDILGEVMEGIELDVLMTTSPKAGMNWGEIKSVDDFEEFLSKL